MSENINGVPNGVPVANPGKLVLSALDWEIDPKKELKRDLLDKLIQADSKYAEAKVTLKQQSEMLKTAATAEPVILEGWHSPEEWEKALDEVERQNAAHQTQVETLERQKTELEKQNGQLFRSQTELSGAHQKLQEDNVILVERNKQLENCTAKPKIMVSLRRWRLAVWLLLALFAVTLVFFTWCPAGERALEKMRSFTGTKLPKQTEVVVPATPVPTAETIATAIPTLAPTPTPQLMVEKVRVLGDDDIVVAWNEKLLRLIGWQNVELPEGTRLNVRSDELYDHIIFREGNDQWLDLQRYVMKRDAENWKE